MSFQGRNDRRRGRSQSLTTRLAPKQIEEDNPSSKEMMNKVLLKREKMILEQMTRQLRLLDVREEEEESDEESKEEEEHEEVGEEDEEDGREKTPPFKLPPLWAHEKKPLQTRSFEKDLEFERKISQASEPINFEKMRHCRYLRHNDVSPIKRRVSAPAIQQHSVEPCTDIHGVEKPSENDSKETTTSDKAMSKKLSDVKNPSTKKKNLSKKRSVSEKRP